MRGAVGGVATFFGLRGSSADNYAAGGGTACALIGGGQAAGQLAPPYKACAPGRGTEGGRAEVWLTLPSRPHQASPVWRCKTVVVSSAAYRESKRASLPIRLRAPPSRPLPALSCLSTAHSQSLCSLTRCTLGRPRLCATSPLPVLCSPYSCPLQHSLSSLRPPETRRVLLRSQPARV